MRLFERVLHWIVRIAFVIAIFKQDLHAMVGLGIIMLSIDIRENSMVRSFHNFSKMMRRK